MDTWNIVLWVAQGLLALGFGMAGFMKAFRYEQAREQMAWIKDVPGSLARFIGGVEMLGAVGVILPRLTGILPWLTPTAAAGLALVMLLAAGFHVSRKEAPVPNVVLLALALFVVYGRFALVA